MRVASYAVVAAGLLAVALCGLGPCLIAGLSAAMILGQTQRHLRAVGAKSFVARWGAVALFLVLAALLVMIFVAFVKLGLVRLPELLNRLLPRLDEIAGRLGVPFPADNARDLQTLIVTELRDHTRAVTVEGGLLTRGFFHLVIAVAVALLIFVTPPDAGAAPRDLDAALLRECRERVTRFAASFELVMGAQVVIAAINTAITAVFLFSLGVPFRTTLVLATFVCGLIPVVGNLVSNAMVVAAALTVSDTLAVAALALLVLVHKGGYFLNGQLIGRRLQTPLWAILLGLLAGEVLMGVPGLILAPTLIHYAREELRALPAR